MKKLTPSKSAKAYIDFLHPNGSTFEVCAMKPEENRSELWGGKPVSGSGIVIGWYNDSKKAAGIVSKLNEVKPEGVYISLNRCQKAMLKLSPNMLKANIDRTKNGDIFQLTNILIDVDPVRPSGVSATETEHQLAINTAALVRKDLKKKGWPYPLLVDSGNGAHLVYRTQLDNNDKSVALIKGMLNGLAQKYNNDLVKIDVAVSNPGRLVKLPGTYARKGDDIPERPHRMAKILSKPKKPKKVSLKILEKFSVAASKSLTDSKTSPSARATFLDVESYLRHYRVEVAKIKNHYSGGKLYVLSTCVFNDNHQPNKASIIRSTEGKLYYQCFHGSCRSKKWDDARLLISGDDKLDQFYPPIRESTTENEVHYSIMSGAKLFQQKVRENLIIKGLLEACGSLLIIGQTSMMKSMLTLNIALNLASETKDNRLWDLFDIPKPVRTLFIQSENGNYGTNKRLRLMVKGDPKYEDALKRLSFASKGKDCRITGDLRDQNFQDTLKILIFRAKARLIVVDPLISYHNQNENDNGEIRKVLDSLTEICEVTKAACLVVHHSGKTSPEGNFAGRGASAIADWAGNILVLTRADAGGEKRIKFVHSKSRNFPTCAPFILGVSDTLKFTKPDSPVTEKHKLVVEVLESQDGYFEDQQSFKQALVNRGVGSLSKAGRMIKDAQKDGLIEEVPKGKKMGYKLIEIEEEQ